MEEALKAFLERGFDEGWIFFTPVMLIVAMAAWVTGVLPAYDWFKKQWGRDDYESH